ncbi:MAG: nucleotidyltransferase substrate binding protein [Bacillota bacterium]|jgi:nucleotidyltransferase substrate binding protein (TIGR01987 family)
MSKLSVKVINFAKALDRLREAVEEYKKPDAGDVIRDGMIQRFEFTYELAWKTTKEYLEDMGLVDRNSPKAVIREAFAQKLITNEPVWLLMINDRNQTSHVYKEEIAVEIATRISKSYIGEFEKLMSELQI